MEAVQNSHIAETRVSSVLEASAMDYHRKEQMMEFAADNGSVSTA